MRMGITQLCLDVDRTTCILPSSNDHRQIPRAPRRRQNQDRTCPSACRNPGPSCTSRMRTGCHVCTSATHYGIPLRLSRDAIQAKRHLPSVVEIVRRLPDVRSLCVGTNGLRRDIGVVVRLSRSNAAWNTAV
ncbi:hypothetical protein BDZ89DRAFT_409216 [Hymenopellis radicata]|nr:hypothetical protein BDZ89DRAFT_409216 [Hymenopellis radicata]